jgi:hypothetical protein
MNDPTPGPWTVQPLEAVHHGHKWPTFAVRSPDFICLAVVGDRYRYEADHNEANAHLMAAAPTLLTACTAALEELRTRCSVQSGDAIYDQLTAAIAAALGPQIPE